MPLKICVLQPDEIESMSLEERFQALELLWASIVRRSDAVQSPPWHGEVLAVRLETVDRGDATFLTIAQVKE